MFRITATTITALAFTAGFALQADAGNFLVLDENVDDVLAVLTNGGGTASKSDDAYTGSESLFVQSTGGDGQKFNPNIPGWAIQIVENPSAENEFRYLTFAWKKDGGRGIQLQMHRNPGGWGFRYHAGALVHNWTPSLQTDENIPAVWTEVTKDLFEDWGAFGVSGMAFTAWDGNGGWWDAVYFHTDPTPPTSVEPQGKLASSWADLKAGR